MSDARKDPVFGRSGDDSAQIQAHPNKQKDRFQDELADLLLGVPEDQLDCGALDTLLEKLEAADPLWDIPNAEESFENFQRQYQCHDAEVKISLLCMTNSKELEKYLLPKDRKPLFLSVRIFQLKQQHHRFSHSVFL